MYTDERNTPQLRRSRHQAISGGERVEQHGDRRECATPDCGTRLSRYNPSTTCAAHQGWKDDRRRNYG